MGTAPVVPAMLGRRPNFETFALKVLARKKLKSKKTYSGARLHIGKLIEFFKGRPLRQITEDAWVSYCIHRRAQNPTCRLFDDRKALTSIMRAAYFEGYVPHQIKFSIIDTKRDVGREITDGELSRIYQYASPELTLQIDIALILGLRYREMLYLQWSSIDQKERLLKLEPAETKTRRGRIVPIPDHLLLRLKARASQSDSRYVFPGRNNPSKPRETNAATWRKCLRKAGVKARWHDLRHTCATRMLRRRVPVHVATAVLGMGTKVLMGIYAHLNIDDLRIAVEG